MLSMKLLPVSALAFVLVTACGQKDDNDREETPVARPEIPLNAPADILGSWKNCTPTAASRSSNAIYTFNADGSWEFKSETFATLDCSGTSAASIVLKGVYVIGAGNALDLSLPIGKPEDMKFDTVYRVFSVQGENLLISNNAGPGADAQHRDYDLNADALKLSKIAL